MLSWQVGNVTIKRLVEFEGPLPGGGKGSMVEEAYPEEVKKIGWLTPHFATDEGHIIAAVQALLIETPDKKIIVDTCVGNDKKRSNPFFNELQTPFLKHLADAGWDREKVDMVLCTHLHVDHVGWNTMLVDGEWVPTFPNADYLIARNEWDHWRKEIDDPDQAPVMEDSVHPIFDAGLAKLVSEDERISDEIRLMPTPGHTPGHVSIVIESEGKTAIITGDIMHHPCQIARPSWASGFDSDQTAARATRAAFLKEVEGKDILVLGTHFAAPTGGYVREEGEGYRFHV